MKILLIAIGAVLASSCSDPSSHFEVITLVAVDEVLLIDPETVAGRPIRVVGRLPAGNLLPVIGCRPRKSDIDVLVNLDGKPAVAWQGKYKLNRRVADARKDPAEAVTTSCWKLLN